MSITLYHPNRSAPTTTVVLPDKEQHPESRPIRSLQTAFETDAGGIFVYSWGFNVSVFTMRLWPLSKADSDALFFFLRDAVNFRASVFDLDDSLGRQYTVRLAQDTLSPLRRTATAYEFIITLRQEA